MRRPTVFNNVSLDGFFTDQMGSGTIVPRLVQAALIDEYQIVVKRTAERALGNGNVLVCYEPA